MSSGAIRGGRVAIEIGADVRNFYSTLNALQGKIRGFGNTLSGIGARMVGLGAAASLPFAGALKQSADFQDTMSAVGAVTGATGEDFEALKKKALDLGASTSFTAQQVADGMQALGQGGFSVEETMQGIDGVLLLARAGMLDLGDAASITVAVLRSFKMPTSEASKVADILAKAANSSNASVSSLGEALSTVSGIAAGVGVSLTEVTAAVGVLADRGMDGSEAGTALRRVLIGLSQEQKKLKALGVEVKDPKTGKLKPLKDILADLKVGLAGMDDTEKLSKLTDIFDVFGANAVFQLMNADDSLEKLTETLGNSTGAAKDAADKMDDNLGGSFRMLMSAVEGVALAMGQALTPELRKLMEWLTGLASGLGSAIQRNEQWVVAIAKAVAGTVLAGGAFLALGLSLQMTAIAVGGFASACKIVTGPITALFRVASMIVGSFSSVGIALKVASTAFVNASVGIVAFSVRAAAMATAYTASLAAMVGRTLIATTAISAAWAMRATMGLFAFAAEVKARITYYTGALAFVTARTVAQTGLIATFWINEAARGIIGFVSQFVVGAATYMASAATMVSASAASAAAVASAWLAPVAPILAISAAISGLVYALGSVDIASTFASLPALLGPLSEGFNTVLADATRAFGEIWAVANTTFSGISDAITAGEMSLAFDVLWAGLKAAWLTGSAFVMGYIDQLAEYLQNQWGNAVSWLAIAITKGMGAIERIWINATGFLVDAWKVSINSVLNIWDTAIGAIQKAIAYIRSFFDKSIDYKKIKQQIDAANKQRKEERAKGVEDSRKDRARRVTQSQATEDGAVAIINEDNAQAQGERAERSAGRVAERQAGIGSANAELESLRGRAAAAKEGADILRQISEATSLDELRALVEQADALDLSPDMRGRISSAADDQSVDLDKTRAMQAQEDEKAKKTDEELNKATAGVSKEQDKMDTAGTFSAAAAMGMGYSSNLAERTAKAAEETAKNTGEMAKGSRVTT
jgi:TP901 family phage tail tape measure protein